MLWAGKEKETEIRIIARKKAGDNLSTAWGLEISPGQQEKNKVVIEKSVAFEQGTLFKARLLAKQTIYFCFLSLHENEL